MTPQFPKVHTDSLNKVFVSFYISGKRYRLYNGKRINSTTDPNSYPLEQRLSIAKVLAAEIYSHLLNGGVLLSYRSSNLVTGKLSDINYIKEALDSKLAGDYSKKYKAMLHFSFDCLKQEIGSSKLSVSGLKNILSRYCSGASHNTLKRHLNVLSQSITNRRFRIMFDHQIFRKPLLFTDINNLIFIIINIYNLTVAN